MNEDFFLFLCFLGCFIVICLLDLVKLLAVLQINPEKAREEFKNVNQKNGGTGVKDFMDGMGLGMLAEQVNLYLKTLGLQHILLIDLICMIILASLTFFFLPHLKLGELKLGELLDTPPPGLDEAIAISKVCLFWLSQKGCLDFLLMVILILFTGDTISRITRI